jgi:hypothetical protein
MLMSTVSWDVTPCSAIEVYRRFGETYGSIFRYMYEFLTVSTTMNKINNNKNYVKHTPVLLILFIVVLTVRNSYIYGIHNRTQSIKIHLQGRRVSQSQARSQLEAACRLNLLCDPGGRKFSSETPVKYLDTKRQYSS